MAALTQNDLKGYIIGNNQFNFQDARVDDLENVANIINRTGNKGIEVRNNRLILTYGGYYEDGCLFEGVNLNWSHGYDNPFPVNSFGSRDFDSNAYDWIMDEKAFEVWISGTASYDNNGDTIEVPFEIDDTIYYYQGNFYFDGVHQSPFGGKYIFNDDNDTVIGNIRLGVNVGNDYAIDDFKITFEVDDKLTNATITINEFAIYTPGSVPMAWPVELIISQDLYDMLVDALINDGYIQSQM